MTLFDRLKLDSIVYRSAKLLAMVAIAIIFQKRFDIFSSVFTMSIAIGWAAVVQLLILVHLPSNDVLPKVTCRDGTFDFLKGEAKFILSLTFMAFFTKWQISELLYTAMLVSNAIIQTLLFLAWRVYNRHIVTTRVDNTPAPFKKNVLIIGSGERGRSVADIFLDHPELCTYVMGFVDSERSGLWRYRDIPLIGRTDDVTDVISRNQVDLVVMALENGRYREVPKIFDAVEKMGTKICVLPEIVGPKISKCRPYSLNGQPVFLYHSVPENRMALLIKELMDRVGAVVGLILSLPIMTLAALAIRIDSKGPIFYRQPRTGKNGKIFEMIKLRTMVNEADRFKKRLYHLNEMTGPVFKIQDDPRVTKVGRFLRKYSIDEFPQFWNVLKGDMSLVGPRPPLPQEVEKFEPWQHRKLSVKPGLSCLWQVNGRNNLDFDHWMKLDLEYIDRWSLAEDAKILIKTIPAVLKGRGAS